MGPMHAFVEWPMPLVIRHVFGAITAIAAGVWWVLRETFKAWFFERVIHMSVPYAEQLVEYGPPALFALLTLWLLYRRPAAVRSAAPDGRAHSDSDKSWLDWRPTPAFIAKVSSAKNQDSSISIDYFDQRDRLFAERISAAFKSAGWVTEFNGTAQHPFNPHYFGGIEVKGDNRYVVEAIVSALAESGVAANATVQPVRINPSNPKYRYSLNRIYLIVGFKDN
jgi:hypothetical protein